MNWTDFFLYLALLYAMYYAINVVIDILRKPHLAASNAGNSYSFQSDLSEFDDMPTVIEEEDLPTANKPDAPTIVFKQEELMNRDQDSSEIEIRESNPIKSTGGVTNLNSLFVLAKEGSIEMKKKVVFI